jgi:hypothetical protein
VSDEDRAQLRAAVRGRPGWRVRRADGVAVYQRPGADWSGQVRRAAWPADRRRPWSATVLVGEVAAVATTEYAAADAVRWIEAHR